MRVSLRTLAREAGVNVATVSRALRGLSCVDSHTRNRILALADKLGYVRDPLLANALAFVRRADKPIYRETIAFLAFVSKKECSQLPWLEQICRGAHERAAELGYVVEYVEAPTAVAGQRILGRQMRSRGIRGVVACLVSPFGGEEPIRLNLDWRHFSGIQVGHSMIQPELWSVAHSLPEDLESMFNELYLRGYRRFGLAVSRHGEETRRWAVMAALLLFKEFHPDLKISILFQDEKEFTLPSFRRWLKRRRPDVLVINGPGVMEWLEESAVRVPEDMGVCRIDCMPGRRESGLQTNYLSLGRLSVNQLISTLEHSVPIVQNAFEKYCVLEIPSIWHEGDTLRSKSRVRKAR